MAMLRDVAWGPKLKWFGAEFLVVVTGVLVALALNAFYQRRQEAASVDVYLSLLLRDVESTLASLDEEVEFEDAQIRDGLVAYRALSKPNRERDYKLTSEALGRLGVRRTLILQDATYQDLLGTGNLRLIHNRELRDRIVDFFERTSQRYEVINKNNSFFVDELYNGVLVKQGLITPGTDLSNVRGAATMDSTLVRQLQSGFIKDRDRLWRLPENAPEMYQVKSVVAMRIRVASIARLFASNVLADTRALKAAVEAERARR